MVRAALQEAPLHIKFGIMVWVGMPTDSHEAGSLVEVEKGGVVPKLLSHRRVAKHWKASTTMTEDQCPCDWLCLYHTEAGGGETLHISPF